jgi:hypothetical protein
MDLVHDPSLKDEFVWHSVEKYLCYKGERVQQLYDELWTGSSWRDIDVTHCLVLSSICEFIRCFRTS